MRKLDDKTRRRLKRRASIRKKVAGTAERPRLTVYKSNRHTYVQAIDDAAGRTLATASNMERDARGGKNVVAELAKLGQRIAERLKEQNVSAVVFDRNGYPFHGKVKAVADGARKSGLKF